MEIEFFGANCFKIKTKKSSIVIDDNLDKLGVKNVTKPDDVLIYTNKILSSERVLSKARLVLDSAGEFEVGDITVNALQTRAHMDEEGQETATVFQCMFGGSTVTILGHVHPDLSADVLELAGGTDVLIVPVGGNGYTLDAVGATSVIKKTEPDVVIPSSYESSGLKPEVPMAPLEDFLKTSGLTSTEKVDSLKVGKATAEQSSQLVILNIK